MESFEPPLNASRKAPYLIGSAFRFEPLRYAKRQVKTKAVQQNIDRFYDQIKNTRGRVRIRAPQRFSQFCQQKWFARHYDLRQS